MHTLSGKERNKKWMQEMAKLSNSDFVILDLCGGTGAWSRPWKAHGYNVMNVDLVNGDDVRLFRKPSFDVYGVLCAPPCDHLAGSGAWTWKGKGDGRLLESLSIVDACLRIVSVTSPVFWALENPVGRLVHYLGKPAMYFHPYEYGDPWTKKTCLWGRFIIPEKNPVEPVRVCSQGSWVQKLGGSSVKTKMLRSVTPSGFAEEFYIANKKEMWLKPEIQEYALEHMRVD